MNAMNERRPEHDFERFRRHGDVVALGRAFDELAPALRRVARHLAHDRSEADDLVQATFLTAIEKREAFDSARYLAPWLTGILLVQAHASRRVRARRIEPDRLDERAGEDPADVVAARELSESLAIALGRMSVADRDVLIPLLLDGRRAVEIARELGRRPDTIHMRIHRGLARLRRLLPASLAGIALVRTVEAHGLAHVRDVVLRRAQLEFQAPAAASVGALAVGTIMSLKKVALVAALVACLAIGGYVALNGLGSSSAMHAAEVPVLAPIENTGVLAPVHDESDARSAVAVAPGGEGSSSANEKQLVLHIVREAGDEAKGARVVLVDSEGGLHADRADDAGACSFAPGNGMGTLYVRDEGAFPRGFDVDLAAGTHTIELPSGGELSGRLMRVDGSPLAGIDVKLSADSAPSRLARVDLAVFAALDLTEYDSLNLVAQTATGSDGVFRFRSLEPGWSGMLKLPLEFVFVDDEQATKSSERHVDGAPQNIEFVVGDRPRIIGRFVEAGTRVPVALSYFGCALNFTDGNSLLTGGKVGADSRFVLPLDYRTDVIRIRFEPIQATDCRRFHVVTDPTWKGPCEPFDAGDIQLELVAGRPFAFRVVDTAGVPLANARARIGRMIHVPPTDAHGIGRYPFVPLEENTMRVVAPGHAVATVALDPDLQVPFDVVLTPTNKLTIVLPPEAAGRKDFRLHLASRELLFGGTSRMYDQILRDGMVGYCFSADGDRGTRDGAVHLGFDESGRIEVEDITTGIPFRVQLVGGQLSDGKWDIHAEVAVESLGPREERRIELQLSGPTLAGLRVLRGRASDSNGRPIHGATLMLGSGEKYGAGRSALDGTFRVDLRDQDSIDVEVTKRGYVPFHAHAWDLRSANPLEAVLHPGRDLRVELVDKKGHATRAARVKAEIDGFGSPWRIEPGATGVFTLCDLPAGRVDVEIEVAGITYRRSLDGGGESARITLPEHGRLEVVVASVPADDDSRERYITLHPIESDRPVQRIWTPWLARVEGYAFESVLPGDYTVGIEECLNAAEEAAPRYAPVSAPIRVTVGSGENVTVEL